MNGEENQDLRTQLEKLPRQIREYYDTYFSALRSELARPDLFYEAIPDYLKGYKRVLTLGGADGVVVVHFPIELEITVSDRGSGETLLRFPSEQAAVEDSYEFVAPFDLSVSELLELISGGKDVGAGISSEELAWGSGVAGVFNAPQQAVDPDTGQLTWQAPWTRLAFADLNHLHFWEDTERAREESWEDIEPYVRGEERKELDVIGAPRAIEEAGVKVGDRGVVLEVFSGRPTEDVPPALLVEYADIEGQTKGLVTYSTDLETIFDIFVDRDFSASRGQISDQSETVREQAFDLPTSSPVVRGSLVTA